VYFAVNVPGELLSMGDGEISDAAIEVPLGARLQVSPVKGQKINSALRERRRNHEHRAPTVHSTTACVFAFTELIAWIDSDYRLADLDSYELLSKGAKIHLNEW